MPNKNFNNSFMISYWFQVLWLEFWKFNKDDKSNGCYKICEHRNYKKTKLEEKLNKEKHQSSQGHILKRTLHS